MTHADAKKDKVKGKVELCPSMKTSALTDSLGLWSCMKQVKRLAVTKRYQLLTSTVSGDKNSQQAKLQV